MNEHAHRILQNAIFTLNRIAAQSHGRSLSPDERRQVLAYEKLIQDSDARSVRKETTTR
jgi:hypothetical protein